MKKINTPNSARITAQRTPTIIIATIALPERPEEGVVRTTNAGIVRLVVEGTTSDGVVGGPEKSAPSSFEPVY